MGEGEQDVVDITLRLTLRHGYWSRPDGWNWIDLLGLEGSENVEVTANKGIRWVFPDGSTMEYAEE